MADTSKNFYIIRKDLVETKSLFIDQDFPPDSRSLTFSGHPRRDTSVRHVVWKRPIDLVRSPKFVSHTANRSDLDQGQLGNCWFVAAASLLVNGSKSMFERVVLQDQGFDPQGYAGMFHFKFWWYGRWVEVVIDDYLPTDGQRLIYCSNWEDKDEFWGALLEKAYAKLRGNYEALDGGKLSDALVDLTGGLGEIIDLNNKSEIPHDMYDLLWTSNRMNSMVGASIHLPEGSSRSEVRRNNGLYMGHAYAITALSVVPYRGGSVKLLRLRNPWGRKEWAGPWSDNSDEIRNLPTDVKRKLNIVIEDEGEFWISFDDFIANFDECQLCHLQPDALAQELANNTKKQNWSVTMYHDAWIKGVTAGGCGNSPYESLYWKNPQFQLHVTDPDKSDDKHECTVIISLMEKEKDKRSKVAIGFEVYQLKDPQLRPLDGESVSKSSLIFRKRSGTYQHYREVVRRFDLPPGYYVIIPSAFHPHQEAEFMLRMYTEREAESEVIDEVNPPAEPVARPQDSVAQMYHKHAGEDGKMDYRELGNFLSDATAKEIGESISFNGEACRSLLTMMDMNQSGFITVDQAGQILDDVKVHVKNRSGFIELDEAKQVLQEVKAYMRVFKQFDKDKSKSVDTLELGTMFNKLGFPVSRMVLTSIVRRYGSRDRKISLEDFIIVLCKLIVMFNIFKSQQQKTGGPDDVAQFTRNEFLQYTMFC